MAKRKPRMKPKPIDDGTVATMVDNPYFSGAHAEGASNPRKTMARLSMRESPVVWMHCHGRIDDAQLQAASRFRGLYERTGGSGVKAMDTTKEPVQGGIMTDGLTDAKMDAAKELVAVRRRLGPVGYELVEAVCGQCLWLRELFPARRTQDRQADRLRDCLDALALFWGYRNSGVMKRAANG